MSGVGSLVASAWCLRFLLAVSLLGLGGCWGGDLARKDRDVRASWSALTAADSIAIGLAHRLSTVWRRSPDDLGKGDRLATLELMTEAERFDPGEASDVARYGAARAEVLAYLKQSAETLASPQSAGLAWRLRGLRKECLAALLRSEAAARAYNEAVHEFNRALGASGRNFAKALLFPGRRRFALLGEE